MKSTLKKLNIYFIFLLCVFLMHKKTYAEENEFKPREQLAMIDGKYYYFKEDGNLYTSGDPNLLRRINDTYFFTDHIGRVYAKDIDGFFRVEGNELDSLLGKKIVYENLTDVPDFSFCAHDKYYIFGRNKMKQLPDRYAIYVNHPVDEKDSELCLIGDSYAYNLVYYTNKNIEFSIRPGYVVSAIKNELLQLVDWKGIKYCIVFIGPNDFMNQTDLLVFQNDILYICDYIKKKGATPVFASYLGITNMEMEKTPEMYNHVIECVALDREGMYIDVGDLDSDEARLAAGDTVHPAKKFYKPAFDRIFNYIINNR